MAHTNTYRMSQAERRWYFTFLGKRQGMKTIRAIVAHGGNLDELIERTHSAVAEPLRLKDRKRLGSNYSVIIQKIPQGILAELRDGDVMQVAVGKTVFVGEKQIYHVAEYKKTIIMRERMTAVIAANLLPHYAAYAGV